MFCYMPFILLGAIFSVVLLDGVIPVYAKSFVYALSLTTKSFVVFLLPAVIFMLLFKTIVQFAGRATKLLFLIFAAVIGSNFLSTMISYQVGSLVYQLNLSIVAPLLEGEGLSPLWDFSLPSVIGNDVAIFAGIILGIVFSFFKTHLREKISLCFERWVAFLLRIFVSIIPVFLIGFLVKLVHDRVIVSIMSDYALIFAIVAAAQFGYILFLYLSANRFKIAGFLRSVKNMLPAGIAGFSSMSSAAAMPLTIVGAEKNMKDPNFARLSIPTTVNIHLIGDCFAIPIFAFAVMKSFGVAEPGFYTYLVFAVYFVMAKFSVAAIPGGGIIVMLPFLESCLGFNAEMASLITALYILFDPVITSANVLGNGAFSQGLSRLSDLVSSFSIRMRDAML
ncbi:MAG: cation:dicarboxylase symporter family transporter [Chlamydiota bacterium]